MGKRSQSGWMKSLFSVFRRLLSYRKRKSGQSVGKKPFFFFFFVIFFLIFPSYLLLFFILLLKKLVDDEFVLFLVT